MLIFREFESPKLNGIMIIFLCRYKVKVTEDIVSSIQFKTSKEDVFVLFQVHLSLSLCLAIVSFGYYCF